MTDIATKTIGELKDLSFYVPSYQRGYRWTEDEVRALLDDINEFSAGRLWRDAKLYEKER